MNFVVLVKTGRQRTKNKTEYIIQQINNYVVCDEFGEKDRVRLYSLMEKIFCIPIEYMMMET